MGGLGELKTKKVNVTQIMLEEFEFDFTLKAEVIEGHECGFRISHTTSEGRFTVASSAMKQYCR